MPIDGHTPVRSTDPLPEATAVRRVLEGAVAPQPEGVVLPYYRPPRLRSSLQTRPALESAVPDEMHGGSPERLRDAAEGSFGSSRILELVIGNDDRVRVDAGRMRTNPWRQIAALRIRASDGGLYVGTGWFIGPRVLATAGHCVYMHKHGGWVAAMDVIPAKHGSAEPFGRQTATRFASVTGWVERKQSEFDYGVLFLDDASLGTRLGNFEVEALADSALTDLTARISGYPADRDNAEHQYYHERPLLSASDAQLVYDVDTFGGQSGSPVWVQLHGQSPVAIGVHTTGGYTSNSGTRISPPVLENLIHWNEEP